MTEKDHEALLKVIVRLQGKVFISGYFSDIYDQTLIGWKRHEWEMPNHSGQGKKKKPRVECLWESPDRSLA
jgi:DNA adenine methylase